MSNNKKNKTFLLALITIAIIAIILVAIFLPKMKSNKLQQQLSLGEKYLQELDYENAIVAFEKAIMIDPKSEDAYLCLADVYIALQDYHATLPCFVSFRSQV